MGLFKTSQIYHDVLPYVDRAANDLLNSFKKEGYNVRGQKLANDEWDISINKGNWIEVAVGLSSALKIKLTPTSLHIHAEAGVGVLGQQVIPTLLAYTIFWPIVLAQVWGLIKQSALDEKALTILHESFERYAGKTVIVKKLG